MTVGIWCSPCRDYHPEGKPVHRLPIQRLLAKQAALEEQIRRLKATLAKRVATIRRLRDQAQLLRDSLAWRTDERLRAFEALGALEDYPDGDLPDTIREAIRHG